MKEERFVKKHKNNYCCRECAVKDSDRKIEFTCSYCGSKFRRAPNKLKVSKHGFYFCSRVCKDKAQSMKGGLKEIQPPHYGSGNGIHNYRDKALEMYQHECEICGYKEYVKILQVHHIDGNRKHNKTTNLILLCPNCHALITRGVATLVDRKIVYK